ncbi:GH1 family beta-glucosidase [Rubrobacter indicoceani]|uniref:GH1 family beta-glucosidase n=1 Tax=Rubrobacter indicoceani TaxID=2051957 RepID=UPI000E5C2636|nr:GH1 family beta-glucosidase [Rubrobacter indicoceani]
MAFPKGFLWGAATASYQIEGAVDRDGRGASIWDTFSHTPGKVYRGDTGDIACDHYHRLEEDLDLMARLGLKAYRFSVAWPRVQPDGTGPANRKGLDFYRRLVDGLRRRDIEPMPTLYHWDLPQALENRGGWTVRETSERFAEYAGLVYKGLSDSVSFWITLNEPWVAAWLGHAAGVHAPGRKSVKDALLATHHLLLGHGLAVETMRQGDGNRLGITFSLSPARPSRDRDKEAARLVDGNANRLYLDPVLKGRYPEDLLEHYAPVTDFSFVYDGDLGVIAAPVDFVGANFYMRHLVRHDPEPQRDSMFASVNARIVIPHAVERTAMGWPVEPEGLKELLVRLKDEYGNPPVYITENGIAVHDYPDQAGEINDEERVRYLGSHFRAAEDAISEGSDLRGYMVWSLLDNFEWAEGYSKRFGLVYVDYPTLKRTLKKSAGWYSEVIRRNGPAG